MKYSKHFIGPRWSNWKLNLLDFWKENYHLLKLLLGEIDTVSIWVKAMWFYTSINDLLFLKVSKACTSICLWTRAMHKYHFVARGVAPKRERLAQAQADLAETQAILEAAKMRLHDVQEGIATLQAKYDDCVRKKDELDQKCTECEQRLVRADKVHQYSKLSII